MSNSKYAADFDQSQKIGGLTASFTIFFGIVLTFFIPISTVTKTAILYIAVGTAVFTAVYYLIPWFYTQKSLKLLPDIFFIFALTVAMCLAGGHGYLYVPFLLLLVAIDAFMFSLFEYALAVIMATAGILFAALSPDLIIEAEYMFGIYVLLALAIILRIFAHEALAIKEEKESLKTAVLELESDKREIRTLLESLSDGMFVVNAESKITFFNKAALKILGIIATQEKILGRDINDFMPTVGENGPELITKEAFGSLQHSVRNDFRIIGPEKTIRLHTNITPVIAEKDLKGAIIFFRDITKEKRIEEQRAEFNAIASHELRTPLSVIEGYLYYILDPTSKLKYDQETREYIEKAHEAAGELNRLVTDILTVVKAEEDELEVDLKEMQIEKFARDVVGTYRKSALRKNIKLTFKKTTSKKIPKIFSDPVKVREILVNLIGNALKFTDKGEVKVELGLLKNEVIVSVLDTGVGIEKSDLGNIYRKFFRAENWETRKTSGAGLGLYIVKVLVERLGGRVGVSSEIGKGSKFYFTVPLKPPKETSSR